LKIAPVLFVLCALLVTGPLVLVAMHAGHSPQSSPPDPMLQFVYVIGALCLFVWLLIKIGSLAE
jgi:apolipoprotein N-acyltransferase